MNADMFFQQIVLNFSKEGTLDRHAFRYLGRTLVCTQLKMNTAHLSAGPVVSGSVLAGPRTLGP